MNTDRELVQQAVDMMEISRNQLGWGMSDAEINLRARLAEPEQPIAKCAECGCKASEGHALYCVPCLFPLPV